MSWYYTAARVAWDYFLYPVTRRIYNFAADPVSGTNRDTTISPLSLTEEELVRKIQSGTFRLYEIVTPSTLENGLLTRYLILDRVSPAEPVFFLNKIYF